MNYDKDFLMKREDLIYFDNAATTFKPLSVINKEMEYLTRYTSNSSRGDYNISFKVNDEIENTRELVKDLINAKDKNEIVFTSGATFSLNLIVFGFFKKYLVSGDEIILNKAEHASNILPWMILAKEKNLIIRYAMLNKDNTLDLESIKKVITNKTKVISLAHTTNVIGDTRNIKEINNYMHSLGILTVVDASQSIPHTKIDVIDMNIDFLAFSAHKMLGPTGLGVMYSKKEYLECMDPIVYGGGMNKDYKEKEIEYLEIPHKFEAGTLNLSAIIAFSESIKYLKGVGYDEIKRKEHYLRKYLINELKNIPYVKILNESIKGSIILINVDCMLSGDLGLYLNTKNICVRSGKHCTKMLKDETDFTDTVRISLYFYNTYEEIDILIDALKKINF